jgi:hypothetical protein
MEREKMRGWKGEKWEGGREKNGRVEGREMGGRKGEKWEGGRERNGRVKRGK